MTDPEFADWARRLFVAFPSLWEWLQRNSPDPKATQAVWRQQLRDYSAEECGSVLDDWSTGRRHPFEAYQRDQVVTMVRAAVDRVRDKERKRRELEQRREAYDDRRRGNEHRVQAGLLVDDVAANIGIQECRPLHRRLMAGEITRYEYENARDEILAKHGIESGKTEPREWVP